MSTNWSALISAEAILHEGDDALPVRPSVKRHAAVALRHVVVDVHCRVVEALSPKDEAVAPELAALRTRRCSPRT